MISAAIYFSGDCEAAMALYKKAFGAECVHIERYDDAPEGSGMNERGDMSGKVMHAVLTICGSTVNVCDAEEPVTRGDFICLYVEMSPDAVRRAYEALLPGGRVIVPIGEQFFSPLYAFVEDRFGVRWQLKS